VLLDALLYPVERIVLLEVVDDRHAPLAQGLEGISVALMNTRPTSSRTKLMYAWTNPAGLNLGRHIGSHVSTVRSVEEVARC
jgi:hypothetical protein